LALTPQKKLYYHFHVCPFTYEIEKKSDEIENEGRCVGDIMGKR
jgi:hypothetical protein